MAALTVVAASLLLDAAAAVASSGGGDVCQPLPPHQCLRGGSYFIKEFDPTDPESQSVAACCEACAAHGGKCQGSQLIATNGKPVVCWLLSTQSVKPHDSDDCNASTYGAAPPTPPPSRFNRTSFSGAWIQRGNLMDFVNASFLVGGDLPVAWSDVEVADGVWDWTATDAMFNEAAAAGFFIETALMTGQNAPAWIYKRSGGNLSVPLVVVKNDQVRETTD
jgi:hypothetical protein